MSTPQEGLAQDHILDSLADGVFAVDDSLRITSVNEAAEQISGVQREYALGRPCREIFHSSLCANGCSVRQTLRTGQPIVDKPAQMICADGREIPVTISCAPLRGPDRKVIGGVVAFRDLSQLEQKRDAAQHAHALAGIIGRAESMQRLFQVLPRFSESSSTVLIEGASGTGKELVARAIHRLSPRREKNFVAVNCSALPDTLLESELFGYKAGAFTDARNDKPGRFALANGGTIFLDEIGDISPAMQTKLLRVLQERVYEPLGSVEPVQADVRVIAATNQNLSELVQQGTFREDLFYRVNIVRLMLPSLKERRGDIPLLAEHFIAKFNRAQGKRVVGATNAVLSAMMAYDFPGNIRELENIVEYAFVLCPGGLLDVEHLPQCFREKSGLDETDGDGSLTLRAQETMHILDAIRRHDGNRSAAARELGIHSSTLYRKIKSLEIVVPHADGRHKK